MTEARTQQRVTLPPAVMVSIGAITSDVTITPGNRLMGVLLLVWGWAWFEQQVTVDPRMIALPSAQWQKVCGHLVSGVANDEINNVNLGLSWMNSGPSSFED